MNLNLNDKVFIVTGGSKGIGEAISRAIAAEGGTVVIASRSKGETESMVKEFQQAGLKSLGIVGDLQDTELCKQVIEDTIDHFGRIDGIVNNAGLNDGASLESGPEAFRKSLNVNLHHYYDLVHYALPHLKESKGSIVNISSKVALTGQGGTSGYAAAKGAQLGLTREWAAELYPFSIRVNAILPAEVMTPLYRKWLDTFPDPTAKEADIVSKIPLEKRMTTSAEIAAMAVFLLSDVSAHTTGQFMIVDGGYVHLDRALT
ncbi:MAG: SDR family oxidoreductase [Saprospiraceae bacterium]|nr:SDR family oxidoreductase [Saprospiraceae bacterium]